MTQSTAAASTKPKQAVKRVDQKILQPRMASGCPKLHQLEHADQDHRNGRGRPAALPRIGEAEGQSNQDEGERMFAVLAEVGMGPQAGRPEGCESDGGREQPGKGTNQNGHPVRIARICNRPGAGAGIRSPCS